MKWVGWVCLGALLGWLARPWVGRTIDQATLEAIRVEAMSTPYLLPERPPYPRVDFPTGDPRIRRST